LILKPDGRQDHQNEFDPACHLDFGAYLLETFFQEARLQRGIALLF
jgi:hypothetical protein